MIRAGVESDRGAWPHAMAGAVQNYYFPERGIHLRPPTSTTGSLSWRAIHADNAAAKLHTNRKDQRHYPHYSVLAVVPAYPNNGPTHLLSLVPTGIE